MTPFFFLSQKINKNNVTLKIHYLNITAIIQLNMSHILLTYLWLKSLLLRCYIKHLPCSLIFYWQKVIVFTLNKRQVIGCTYYWFSNKSTTFILIEVYRYYICIFNDLLERHDFSVGQCRSVNCTLKND